MLGKGDFSDMLLATLLFCSSISAYASHGSGFFMVTASNEGVGGLSHHTGEIS